MGMGRKNDPLTIERARELFDYNKETGELTRKIVTCNRAKLGPTLGTIADNRMVIGADSSRYRVHRLAYFIVTGEWPVEIDHINGDATDNRWINLRNVTHKENLKNRKVCSNNASGVMGVGWNKATSSWSARLTSDGVHVHIGLFGDWFDAVCARKSAENSYGFHENHGRAV